MSSTNKAIVIGASSGIGRALALLLASNGYVVGISSRRSELLVELKSQHPNRFHFSAFDVTNNDLIGKLNSLVEALGGLDLLIFCSGVGELNATLKIDLELSTINVNVKAFNEVMIWGYHFFEKQANGHMVAISSIAGLRGGGIAPAYNASKAYQINYMEGLRQKVKKQKLSITITDVRPGFVDTAMAKGDKKFWVSSPEKVATQILHAINSKRNVIYVTKRWQIIAWLLKLMPRFLYERM